jgi:peptidyl-dipeptidase A
MNISAPQRCSFPVFGALLAGVLLMPVFATAQEKEKKNDQSPEARAKAFISRHESQIRPLEIASGLAWWNANVSGKDEDFAAKEAATNKLNEALSDKQAFAELAAIKKAGIEDELLARQIEVLFLYYQEKQVDPALLARITSKANAIEQAFNVFRAEIGGEKLTDSQVREILSKSKDLPRRQAAWEASKKVGAAVQADLADLVRLRNEAATALGYKNYHQMQLRLNEQDPEQVLKLFDELDELTREPFARVKADIDERLAKSYGVAVAELRPWHYHDPFFQEAPAVYETSLDSEFADVDIVDVCRRFYAGIGLPVDEVLAKSDLYEKPGKSPHAFCTDIDRAGDVRVLANIVPNEYWMGTMLHELGHAVYSSRYIPQTVPYVVRSEAHILSTEGVAMMFERFNKSAAWLKGMGIEVSDPKAYDETGARMRRNRLLIFSRWCQVMLRFEMAMYADPQQDLNKLWWDLVEKYQLVTRPADRDAPDYGAKIHVVSAPAYYHNYMMGELFACQLHHAIARDVLKTEDAPSAIYYDNPAVGKFMQERVFDLGRTVDWAELTERATGEPLGAKAFAAEFAE